MIIVTGSPGTGKTELARQLARKLGYEYVDVNLLIKKQKISDGFDEEKQCEIIDTEKLNKVLVEKYKGKNAIVDSHLSHYLPAEFVDLCIVTKCNLKVLEKRLMQRGYDEKKIRDNLDAEIFDICLTEAKEAGHKVVVVDTSQGFEIDKLIKQWGLK